MDALKRFQQGCVIPAMPLALNNRREWDERRQRALVRYYLAAGAGGLAVGVHTTQFAIRQTDYFRPLLALVMAEVEAFTARNGTAVMCIAGACGPAAQAVKEAELAKKLGYHAVMLSPGGLPDLTEAEMLARTDAVLAVLPVVGFYLQPSVGGRLFTYDYWEKLCAKPGLIGIKAAPFNRYQTLDLVRAAATSPRRDEIALYTGNDDNILLDLLTEYAFTQDGKTYKKGFVGGLLGHWAVWTKAAVQQLEMAKGLQGAKEIPAHLLTLAQEITDTNAAFFDTANGFKGCIAGIHEVLRRQGLLEGTWCLDPDEALSPGQSEEIDRIYAMYPHLHDDEFVKTHLDEWLNG